MNKRIKRIAIFLVFIMVINYFLPMYCVLAETDYLKDKFNFTSNENNNIQVENNFEYSDYFFKKSSFEENVFLELLSAEVSISSVSWYGENVDPYEIDPSENAHNLVDILNKMEFKNVSTNKYYSSEKEENSVGVAVGYKEIKTDEDTYTLLAIIPRSAGYKQEWAGNFTVGDSSIHEGFKHARDEVLRFVKKYINENKIEGKIKVWTAGHSRGSAIANMIGGFFAGGGIEYFDNVSITPEDVYCYTFATPKTIKNNLDKNIELSVEGNRTGNDYVNDTQGEAYQYTKGGQVNKEDQIYNGIKNIVSSSDIITMLPPEEWGFTYYGQVLPVDYNGVTEEEMLNELKTISPYTYNKYINGASPKTFERKDFDLSSLSIVKDNGNYSAMNINTLLKERIKGLIYNAMTNKDYYDEGYQDVLKSIAGIYGMSLALFGDDSINLKSMLMPVVLSYLSYAEERLIEEGRASNENDALLVLLVDLLEHFTGEEIDKDTLTLDEFVIIVAKYLSDNENKPVFDEFIDLIIKLIPADYVDTLTNSFSSFAQTYEGEKVSLKDSLKAFFKACYYGADPNSMAEETYQDPQNVRQVLYFLALFALYSKYDDIGNLFLDSNGSINGHVNITYTIDFILNLLKNVKDENGNKIKEYNNLGELADDKLNEAIDSVFQSKIDKSGQLYGNSYKTKFSNHVNYLKDNISKARRMIMYALFYEEGDFSVSSNIKTALTFIGNASIIPIAHYNELYIAYSKARREKLNGEIVVVENETNYGNAVIDEDAKEIISNIPLTDEEFEKVNEGKNIEVFLEVNDLTDTVNEEDKKQIEDNLIDNQEVALYLDINIFKKVEDEESVKVSKLNKPVKISFVIPDKYLNNNQNIERVFKVFKLHDGVLTELNVTVNGNIATFETDEFSTYALTYIDTDISTIVNPPTWDNITTYITILELSIVGLVSLGIITKKRYL